MKHDKKIREAIGIFFDARNLHDAMDELEASGFDHRDIGLLAGEHTVRQALGDLYREAQPAENEGTDGPRMAFVRKESLGDGFRAWAGSLFFAGTTVGMGAAVASAGVLGGALLAAAAGVAAVGAVGGVLGMIIHQSDAEYLEEQVDEGHLLLFVRTRDADHERRAMEILNKHSGTDVRIHEVGV
jgi:predicted phage tail protein